MGPDCGLSSQHHVAAPPARPVLAARVRAAAPVPKPAGAGATKPAGAKKSPGPFAAVYKVLSKETRPKFAELMKKLREAKQLPKETRKTAMQNVDSDVHKLLGENYKT